MYIAFFSINHHNIQANFFHNPRCKKKIHEFLMNKCADQSPYTAVASIKALYSIQSYWLNIGKISFTHCLKQTI